MVLQFKMSWQSAGVGKAAKELMLRWKGGDADGYTNTTQHEDEPTTQQNEQNSQKKIAAHPLPNLPVCPLLSSECPRSP